MKIKLVDDYTFHLPIAICAPLNADFDGDCLSVQLVPEELKEDVYKKMSPRYVSFYKKNMQPIPQINLETLNGLACATSWTPDKDAKELTDPIYYFDDYSKLLKAAEIDKTIKVGTPVTFSGKAGDVEYKSEVTTYGRVRISKILGKNIEDLEFTKNKYDFFEAKAATKLSAYLCDFPEDGVEKRLELQKFCLRVVSMAGVVTFDYKTLFVDCMNRESYKELCKVADSPDLTDKQKLCLLTEMYSKYEKEIEDSFSDDLAKELSRAGKVKLSSISALNMPQLIVSGVKEKPIITRGNLLGGYSEKDMIYHSIENRSLQSIKQSGTPNSGYLTRQISFVLNNYVYKVGEDSDNPGLLIPRYKANGRTAPNGKVYDTFRGTPSESDLVPVRSIVTKLDRRSNYVTSDLISTKFKDFTDGAAIGLSFATSLTEAITQGALGLKHGGHERVLDQTCYLKIDKPCTFREEGNWIYLKVKGKSAEQKYPRPANIITFGKTNFEAGESICCAYNTTSPISKLNSLIKLMNAQTSKGNRFYEKDEINGADCYALDDGEIKYIENDKGEIEVKIGDRYYDYNPNSMYYFPDGAKVKKLDRICSGVVQIFHVVSELKDNLNDIYAVFRKQFYSLIDDKNMLKKGITDLTATQEEIVELLFSGLTRVYINPDTQNVEDVQFLGAHKAVTERDSFFNAISFGWAGGIVTKAIKGEVDLSGDIMTETILGLLLDSKLDDK